MSVEDQAHSSIDLNQPAQTKLQDDCNFEVNLFFSNAICNEY